MPDEHSVRLEDTNELSYDSRILRGMREEAKGRKEIQYCIKPSGPAGGHLSHVTACVSESRASAALAGHRQQFTGVIETVHIVSRLGQQVRVSPLAARDVEYARSYGQTEEINETRRFLTIALRGKERAVLQEVVGVEGRLPPLARLRQKKTGSRYAPNTVSIAARIS